MKKLFIILLLPFVFSCSTDTVTEDTCECIKQTWVNDNGNGWYWNGGQVYYSDDCSDDGDVLTGYSGQGWEVEYRIKCN